MNPSTSINTLEGLVQSDPDAAATALSARIAACQDQPDGHDDEARIAESLGLISAALRAWQLHLRDHPNDQAAWQALAVLHEERGDPARASACRARLTAGASGEETGLVSEPEEPELDRPDPSDADLVRFCHLFGGREGVHARMFRDGHRGVGYTPVRHGLTPEIVRAHWQGAVTVGSYLVRADDTVTTLVFDLDATRQALDRAEGDALRTHNLRRVIHVEGLRMQQHLRSLGLDPVLVDSGHKGRHLWLFLDRPTAAAEVRRIGKDLLASLRPDDPRLSVELFPKQGRVAPGGLGNLVKLPLGVHLRTGRRCQLLDDHGEPVADPFALLRRVHPAPLPRHLPPAVEPTAPVPTQPEPAPPAPPVPDAPAWSEADFEADPEVSTVLGACDVLRALVDEALETRSIDHDGAVVLAHSLGHLARGPDACNYVFDRVPAFPAEARMGGRHRGSPTSCGRIRKRLRTLCARTRCDCSFSEVPGQYDNPLRHLEGGVPAARPPGPSIDDLLAAWGRHLERILRLEQEGENLRRAAARALAEVPGGRWAVPGGEWALVQDEGLPVLQWHPLDGQASAVNSGEE